MSSIIYCRPSRRGGSALVTFIEPLRLSLKTGYSASDSLSRRSTCPGSSETRVSSIQKRAFLPGAVAFESPDAFCLPIHPALNERHMAPPTAPRNRLRVLVPPNAMWERTQIEVKNIVAELSSLRPADSSALRLPIQTVPRSIYLIEHPDIPDRELAEFAPCIQHAAIVQFRTDPKQSD